MKADIPLTKASKTKAPYKRRMTEKRKVQNRAAQAIYREKQKIRIAELERIAALRLDGNTIVQGPATSSFTKDLNETVDQPADTFTGDQLTPDFIETLNPTNRQDGPNENFSFGEQNLDISETYNTLMEFPTSSIDRDWGASLGFDPIQSLSQFMQPRPSTSLVGDLTAAPRFTNHNADVDPSSVADLGQDYFPAGRRDKTSRMSNIFPRSVGSESSLTNMDLNPSILSSRPMQLSDALLPAKSSGIGGHTKSSQYNLLWESLRYVIQMDVVEDAQSLLNIAMETNRNLASVFLYGLDNTYNRDPMHLGDIFVRGLRAIRGGTSIEISSKFSATGLADPYSNNLQILRASTLDAYICNAREIGLVEEDFYHEVWRSPFYRANLTSPHDIKAFQDTFKGKIAPNLLPMPEQIMYQHHPFLDVLPFPSMRSRAVSFMSFSPPLLDLVDFKRDVSRDGLICWHADKKGCGNPTDMRSWEAAPWFLKKWWLLLGGKEGEAWEQTKWWREFRGESMSSIFDD